MELNDNKFWKKSYKTQSQIGQTVLVKKRIYEERTLILSETIEDMDEEIVLKDNKTTFSLIKLQFQMKKLKNEWEK